MFIYITLMFQQKKEEMKEMEWPKMFHIGRYIWLFGWEFFYDIRVSFMGAYDLWLIYNRWLDFLRSLLSAIQFWIIMLGWFVIGGLVGIWVMGLRHMRRQLKPICPYDQLNIKVHLIEKSLINFCLNLSSIELIYNNIRIWLIGNQYKIKI